MLLAFQYVSVRDTSNVTIYIRVDFIVMFDHEYYVLFNNNNKYITSWKKI